MFQVTIKLENNAKKLILRWYPKVTIHFNKLNFK